MRRQPSTERRFWCQLCGILLNIRRFRQARTPELTFCAPPTQQARFHIGAWVAIELECSRHCIPISFAQALADGFEAGRAIEAGSKVVRKRNKGRLLPVRHLPPVRHSTTKLLGDLINLSPHEHIGFDHGDLVATLNRAAAGVARGAVTDRVRLCAGQRIGICGEVTALKFFNEF